VRSCGVGISSDVDIVRVDEGYKTVNECENEREAIVRVAVES
jgi:hypothetical protein